MLNCLINLIDFAKEKFNLPCSLGAQVSLANIEDAEFTACSGLLLSGFDNLGNNNEKVSKNRGLNKLKKWFKIFLP